MMCWISTLSAVGRCGFSLPATPIKKRWRRSIEPVRTSSSVQSDEAVAARLPGLRAAVRSYLSADDPRREIYLLRIDAALTTIGAERLAEAARPAARMSEQRTEEVDDVADPGG